MVKSLRAVGSTWNHSIALQGINCIQSRSLRLFRFPRTKVESLQGFKAIVSAFKVPEVHSYSIWLCPIEGVVASFHQEFVSTCGWLPSAGQCQLFNKTMCEHYRAELCSSTVGDYSAAPCWAQTSHRMQQLQEFKRWAKLLMANFPHSTVVVFLNNQRSLSPTDFDVCIVSQSISTAVITARFIRPSEKFLAWAKPFLSSDRWCCIMFRPEIHFQYRVSISWCRIFSNL